MAASDAAAASPPQSTATFTNRGFRDRRTSLFTIATVTGVLALLLMLGRQLSQLWSPSLATGTDELSSVDDGNGSEAEDESSRADLNDVKATVTGPDSIAFRGLAPVEAAKTSDPNDRRPRTNSTIPASVASTDNGPFTGDKKPASRPRVEFDEPVGVSPRKSNDEPGQGGPRLSSPFEEPTTNRTNPSAGIPAAKSASRPDSNVSSSLGLEVVRTSVSTVSRPDLQFLVTSVNPGVPSAGDEPGKKPAADAILVIDGWRATRDAAGISTIVRTRHGRPSAAGVSVTSTATSRWTIAAPKLKLQILLPPRIVAGKRVPVRLRIVNVGTATAERVTLHVDLPEEMTYFRGRRLTYAVGDLPAGGYHEARLTPTAERSGDASVSATAFCKTDRTSGVETRSIAKAAP